MKLPGEVTQFYWRECSDKGVRHFGNNDKGLCCDGCHKFLKYLDVKTLRHIIKNRYDFFRCTIQVQYKSHLLEYYVEYITNIFRTNPKNLIGEGKVLLRTVRYNLELHHEIKYTLPPE